MHNELPYQIALTLIPGIGPVKAKNLLSHCGSAQAVFKEKAATLKLIPEIGEITARLIKNADVMQQAEDEITFITQNHVKPLFFSDLNYPEKLKLCDDGPLMLYTKGKMDLNTERVISIVGTRKATAYGKDFCSELLQGVAHLQPLIVSGLAYGIDICAHRNAVKTGLQTVACVAHGLNKIYPSLHASVAVEMMANGGLVSEFVSTTRMSPELFPMRNRIIAGMADCTIVVETDMKGGSLITAHIANSYGREVFALPGRHYDPHSTGCNELIRKNIAAILTSPQDLVNYMNWTAEKKAVAQQLPIFPDLNKEEFVLVNYLREKGIVSLDMLSIESGHSFSRLSTLLLQLEFRGVVKSLPGKHFSVV